MNRKHLYLLLNIVKSNRNVNALLRENLTYKQIGDLIQEALESNFIEKTKEGVILTMLGEIYLRRLSQQQKKTNKEDWIERENNSKIEKLDGDFIYLPKQEKLSLD